MEVSFKSLNECRCLSSWDFFYLIKIFRNMKAYPNIKNTGLVQDLHKENKTSLQDIKQDSNT